MRTGPIPGNLLLKPGCVMMYLLFSFR